MEEAQSVAILGGSFDPVHNGHLTLAKSVLELGLVDKVVFVPAYCQPMKSNGAFANFSQRFAMLELAIQGLANCEVSDIEARRQGMSYTYDTLQEFSKEYKDARLFFLMGTDCLQTIGKWYQARQLVEKYSFIIYPRNNSVYEKKQLIDCLGEELGQKLLKSIYDLPTIDVSSNMLRDIILENKKVNDFLPLSVIEYIKSNKLYK